MWYVLTLLGPIIVKLLFLLYINDPSVLRAANAIAFNSNHIVLGCYASALKLNLDPDRVVGINWDDLFVQQTWCAYEFVLKPALNHHSAVRMPEV